LTRVTIIAVGKRMPDWIESGFAEYKKRLSHELVVDLTEITPARRSKSTNTRLLREEEAAAILKAIPERDHVIALDEHGKRQTTLQFSSRLQDWIDQRINVSVIIGGADGLDESVLNAARERWSMSDFTLPHALVRVVLIEQLYRAWTVLKNHPYHRE
jgi:23S rRNA (pseudouridine1915-N3)-methyltransferase